MTLFFGTSGLRGRVKLFEGQYANMVNDYQQKLKDQERKQIEWQNSQVKAQREFAVRMQTSFLELQSGANLIGPESQRVMAAIVSWMEDGKAAA